MSQEHHPSAALGKKNRLASSQSPYLLQHAENPVDWYPWGPEAFERAKAEDKPVFLSIGYSTCHWCHVMAHESFEDAEVARLMNEAFVSIKVDREERPDIDGIYMTVCQMMTQRGGWPLTIIMTPDQKPFFAGTYFPKESRFGRVGMTDLVPQIKDVWENRRDEVYKSAEHITEVLGSLTPQEQGDKLLEGVLPKAYQQFADGFDEEYGGFGGAPKFPTPHNFFFLLRYGHRFKEPRAIEMVERTLQAMRRGGVYDHLGFGFHRYSTDREWLLPHFEKMLYDQALLAMAFIEAYQVTGKEEYRRTAEEIFEYVLRDMTSPEGGFYSAEDADSEGEEGRFYVWTEEEIRDLLEEEEADRFIEVYNVKEGGNFSEEATGRKTGANILHLAEALDDSTRELLEGARKKLFEAREKRIHPYKDDKILTDWNGLMITALAKGARVFQEPGYAEAAGRAADFLLEKMRAPDKGLLHRCRNGEAGIEGLLDDYAFFIHGLIHLYEATFDVERLQTAMTLNREMIDRFWDGEGGGFFFTASDSEKLIVRRKEIDDGALPSGNSMAMLNLLRLSRITGNGDLEKMAETIGAVFSGQVSRGPRAFSQVLVAVDFGTADGHEVVVAGRVDAPDTETMIRALAKPFLPHMVLLFRPEGEKEPGIVKIAEFAGLQTAIDGRAAAYVCSGFTCEEPTTDPTVMLGLLGVK